MIISGRLRLSQSRLPGADDCVGAVSDLQLDEDVRDVVAHGLGVVLGNEV
jgi:hypothetical protein